MIEAIVGIITAIVSTLVSAIGAAIEFIAGLFVAGGEALSAGEAIILLLALVAELVAWFFLWIKELLVSLFTWRKPRKVPRPRFRRSKVIKENSSGGAHGS